MRRQLQFTKLNSANMPHCINIKHPEFIKLLNSSGLKEAVLKAKLSVWQERTGNLDEFPDVSALLGGDTGVNRKLAAGPVMLQLEQAERLGAVLSDKLIKFLSWPWCTSA